MGTHANVRLLMANGSALSLLICGIFPVAAATAASSFSFFGLLFQKIIGNDIVYLRKLSCASHCRLLNAFRHIFPSVRRIANFARFLFGFFFAHFAIDIVSVSLWIVPFRKIMRFFGVSTPPLPKCQY